MEGVTRRGLLVMTAVRTPAEFDAAITPVAEGGHVLLADGLFLGSVTIARRIVVSAANRLAAGRRDMAGGPRTSDVPCPPVQRAELDRSCSKYREAV